LSRAHTPHVVLPPASIVRVTNSNSGNCVRSQPAFSRPFGWARICAEVPFSRRTWSITGGHGLFLGSVVFGAGGSPGFTWANGTIVVGFFRGTGAVMGETSGDVTSLAPSGQNGTCLPRT
jgi:hypothetical protein